MQGVPDYTSKLLPVDNLDSRPLAGIRFGIITETVGDGVDEDVVSAIRQAAAHLESLGASVREVGVVYAFLLHKKNPSEDFPTSDCFSFYYLAC